MMNIVNKKILKMVLMATLLVALAFVGAKAVLAATCEGIGSPVQCPTGSFGEDMEIRVRAYNNNGDPILGSVSYTWTLLTPTLGALTPLTANPLTLGTPSRANLKIGYNYASPTGSVQVVASYGGGSITKVFDITTLCTDEPRLVYGIAGISDSGKNSYQYSTAEVLETCRAEYNLYAPAGGRY